MILDHIWAMQRAAFANMLTGLNRSWTENDSSFATLAASLEAGLADDAERAGYPIKRIGGVALVGISGVLRKNPSMFATMFMGITSMGIIKQAIV